MVRRKPSVIRVSAALAAVALVAACGDGSTGPAPPVTVPNRAPAVVGTIPGLTLTVGDTESVAVSSYFNDPDGDALSYTAGTSDAEVATASVSGSTVTLTGVSAGMASVTVTASDPDGLSASQSFDVTVPNRAPAAVGTIPGLTLTVGDTESVDVSSYFSDPDGDALSYTAGTSDAEVATTSVSDSTVTLTGVSAGMTSVTVTASDPDGLSALQSFDVTAEGPRPQASLSVIAPASPEGGVAILEVVLTPPEVVLPPRESPVVVSYTLGVDGDPGTADADASDYADVASGVVEIGTESNGAVIEITIHDDDHIEPVREVFTVTLDAPAEEADYNLGSVTSAVVTIEEGVCDRTSQVRDEIIRLAGVADCTETEDRHMAGIQRLDLNPKSIDVEVPITPILAVREGDFSGLSNLLYLYLAYNELTELPPGIFSGLSNLRRLVLHHNALTELPPAVFSGLSSLRYLGLSNALTELPPGIFSGLSRLEQLRLDFNQLSELPQGIFSGLSRLTWLTLEHNALTELPPGISGLSRLEVLRLRFNQLSELPQGIFSDLASLRHLDLRRNLLTELPPGIFSGLASLESLDLSNNPGAPFRLTLELVRTDSDDPVSRGPATLEVRLREGAPFAMTIPLSARGGTLSTESVSLATGATVSTEATLTPAGSGAVSVTGGPPTVCSEDGPYCRGVDIVAGGPLIVANPITVALSVPAAHLTQGAQDLTGGVPLIAGRKALLRVFPTADDYYTPGHQGQATFFVRGQEVYKASLAPASSIPIEVDEGRLDQSYNAMIPGHVLQPGLEMVVELDPDAALSLKPGSRTRFPASGRLALDVRDVLPMHLTIIPVLYDTEGYRTINSQIENAVRNMATTDSHGVLRYTRDVLPIGDLNVKLREPYYTFADTDGPTQSRILTEIEMLRHLEAGYDEYYHGIFASPNVDLTTLLSPGGQAFRPGHAAVSLFSGAAATSRTTFAHELGHNLSLGHAPCGSPDFLDPDFPYADSSIGVWGHRFLQAEGPDVGRLFRPEYNDLMSYCHPQWTSDYNFTKAMTFRLASPPAAFPQPLVASQTTTLLQWGGVQEGDLRLEPAFVHDARVKLPGASGPYQLTGLDAEGRRLFSLSFTPDELDHGGSSFLFAVPFEPAWTQDLDRVTLTGPEGSTTLDRDTGGRAALILDRASGRVRTIARDWSDGAPPAAMPANAQVEIVRGLPRR